MSPIDPRLPLMGVPPPNPAQAWQDAQGLALGQQRLQLGQQQMQENQMILQERRRQFDAEQQLDQAYANAITTDPQTGQRSLNREKLLSGVPGHLVPGLMESFNKLDASAADLAEKQMHVQQSQLDLIGDMASTVKASGYKPEVFLAGIRGLQRAGVMGAEQATGAAMRAIEDPSQIQTMTDQYLAGSPAHQKLQNALDVARERSQRGLQRESGVLNGKIVDVTFDPNTGKRFVGGQDVSDQVQPVSSTITPEQQARLNVEQATAARTERHQGVQEAIERARLGLEGQRVAIERERVAQNDPNAPPIVLSPTQEGVAKDMSLGKLSFADFNRIYGRAMGNARVKEAIYARARQLNEGFSPVEFELGQKMAGNPQIRQRIVAINSLSPVIDQAEALSKQVGASDIPALNKLILGAKFQLGNQTVTNFRQLQTLLGDEVGNALGVGSGSDLKTKLGLDLVNPNLGPAQFAATMEQLRSVLGARKQALIGTMGPYGNVAEPTTSGPAVGTRRMINGRLGEWDGKGWKPVQ